MTSPTPTPAPLPTPDQEMAAALVSAHLAAPPHPGTDRGEALSELIALICLTADDLDQTLKETRARISAVQLDLDVLATGAPLTASIDQPTLAAAGAILDILTAVSRTQTHHLRLLIRSYKQLNITGPNRN
ncbi:hypothetical protein [Kitasatospora sp. NBC_01266]|uniref:hypothetical protein n=1 Tax=Kitasatospora sp. NBC_01266 TaxID=2903572 RepID=UPI002E34B2AD|nr:hypothetical protein [Kitasatospora sp. NBC_01266]